ILNGKNQDSDYFGNNRTLEFSRSNNQANKGDVWDITLGIGYKITAISKKLFIYPIGGFSYNAQNLRMTDGFQTLDPYGQIGFTGPFSGLNSTYDAKWFGLWTGFDLNWKIIKELSLTLGFEVHFTSYTAEADWNLRQDFLHPKSFKHEAFGMGINLSVCIAYDLTDNWVINTEFTYLNWWTNRGIDRTYMANGTIIEGNINEVLWKSFSISLGVNYKF
ncbi:MAG: TonB-dependent receptor, partial [Spirochaetota bacterium]|nr:TonB-dependent receptor [Spirochaetota bacterium]